MTDAQKKKLLATAVKAAYGSGDIMRRNRLAPKKINEATQRDIKLELDVRCQRKIESILTRAHPEIGILGEEENAGDIETELRWVVDPIDGTVNFAYGIPHACVSIALQRRLAKQNKYGDDYETITGVVFDPFTDELWTAIKGQAAKLNGKKNRVRMRVVIRVICLFTDWVWRNSTQISYKCVKVQFCHLSVIGIWHRWHQFHPAGMNSFGSHLLYFYISVPSKSSWVVGNVGRYGYSPRTSHFFTSMASIWK